MNNDIQRFDDIQHYLDGNMSAEERQAFEAQMAVDTNLADEVGAHRIERELMDILLEDDLTTQMQTWQEEKVQMQSESKQPKLFTIVTPRVMRIAATIILVVSIGIVFLVLKLRNNGSNQEPAYVDKTEQNDDAIQNPPATNQEQTQQKNNKDVIADNSKKAAPDQQQQKTALIALAEEFGGTPDFSGTSIRSGEEATSRFDSAVVFIQEKKYDAAIRLLQTIPNDDPEIYINAQLNLGYLYFVKKNYKASIPPLAFAAANQDFLYAEAAEWYISLAYLGNGQKAAAIKRLNRILADQGHPYYEKATELSKRLR